MTVGLGEALAAQVRWDEADPLWADRDRVFARADLVSGDAGVTAVGAAPGLAFGAGVGAALAERTLAARFGRSLVDHRVWVVADIADLASGVAHEAAALAGALGLGRLTVLACVPGRELRGLSRFAALGWAVRRIEENEADGLEGAVLAGARTRKPMLIATAAGFAGAGEAAAGRGGASRRAWLKRLRRHGQADLFSAAMAGRFAVPAAGALGVLTEAGLAAAMPDALQLPPDGAGRLSDTAWAGRDQGVAAMLLGVALHGGLLPVGRFTLAGAEAARPAVREAAAQSARLLLVLQEGPACPVGGLRAGWRAMRNVLVLRPGDLAEAADCASLALRRTGGPGVLLLGAGLAAPAEPGARPCARGAYVAVEAARRDVTLIASGTDLEVAQDVRRALAADEVAACVVSLPCWTLFAAQDAAYRAAVLGDAPRVGLEAGSGAGWRGWIGEDGLFLDSDAETVAGLAARILRHLGRRGRILEKPDSLLESGAPMA